MANEIGRNIQRFFVKVEESITENKRCKLCSKSVNDNAAFLQLERLKFMFFLSYSPSSLRAFQHVKFAYPLQVLNFVVVYFIHHVMSPMTRVRSLEERFYIKVAKLTIYPPHLSHHTRRKKEKTCFWHYVKRKAQISCGLTMQLKCAIGMVK